MTACCTCNGATLPHASAVPYEEPCTGAIWQQLLVPLAGICDGLQLQPAQAPSLHQLVQVHLVGHIRRLHSRQGGGLNYWVRVGKPDAQLGGRVLLHARVGWLSRLVSGNQDPFEGVHQMRSFQHKLLMQGPAE